MNEKVTDTNDAVNGATQAKLPRHTELLMREPKKGSTNSATLKEKIVDLYEQLFQGIKLYEGNDQFWEELFLLRVNLPFLERCIFLNSEEHLVLLKDILQTMFYKCSTMAENGTKMRVAHALETLAILVKSLLRKNFSPEQAIEMLVPKENRDTLFTKLFTTLQQILELEDIESYLPFKSLSLNILLLLAAAAEYPHKNPLMKYFMKVDFFNTLIKLCSQHPGAPLGLDAICLLTILVGFESENQKNPYRLYVIGLDKTGTMNLLQVILLKLNNTNQLYSEIQKDDQAGGVISRVSNYFSTFFTPPPKQDPSEDIRNGVALLALNRISSLTIEHLLQGDSLIPTAHSEQPDKPAAQPPTPPVTPRDRKDTGQATLVSFITYCSHLFQNLDKDDALPTQCAKLCLHTLLDFLSDEEFTLLLHALVVPNLVIHCTKSKIHPHNVQVLAGTGPTLACGVIDVLLLLLKSNMRKKFPFELYRLALLAIRKLAIFHKKNDFICCHGDEHWHELWRSTFVLLSFIARKEEIKTNSKVLVVAEEVIELFNLFIASGHNIFFEVRGKGETPEEGETGGLHTEQKGGEEQKKEAKEGGREKEQQKGGRDDKTTEESKGPEHTVVVWTPGSVLFYYKMVQDSKIIQSFAEIVNLHSKELAKRLENITGIVIHFNLKIGEWLLQHPHEALTTAEQVEAIILANYASLQLVSGTEFLGESNLYARSHQQIANKEDTQASDSDEEGGEVEALTRAILLKSFGERYIREIVPVPPASFVG